tara:strand:- start:2437 stop:2694 length:258 start_codon:yes stop_codon:yes gene_type:complete
MVLIARQKEVVILFGFKVEKRARPRSFSYSQTNKESLIGWSRPISGNHNDSFELQKTTREIFEQMQRIGWANNGLFLNADAGLDD